jgi:hypothetical protein
MKEISTIAKKISHPPPIGNSDLDGLIDVALAPVDDECDARKALRCKGGGWTVGPRRWRKNELARRASYNGLVLSYTAREALKYQWPAGDAPLVAWILELLKTARSHWSRAVLQERCRLQFRGYLPKYLRKEDWFERFGGRWCEAARAIRSAL